MPTVQNTPHAQTEISRWNAGRMIPAQLSTPNATFTLRRATGEDLASIIRLLAADQLRASVESDRHEDRDVYQHAFDLIDVDPAQALIVVEAGGDVVATMQLTFIPGLARFGAMRMQIEAVRVAEALRGHGLGTQMIEWAIDEARERGVKLVQLTSDNSRLDAHRFYTRIGFTDSHVGFKLSL